MKASKLTTNYIFWAALPIAIQARVWIVASFMAMALFSGCAQQTHKPNSHPKEHIPQWQLNGKIAVLTPREKASVLINWRQNGTDYRVNLTAPLGQGSASLSKFGNQVTLKQSGKPTLQDSSASTLIKKHFGWQVPFEHLTHWVKGIPSPNIPWYSSDQHPESGFQQDGWELRYSKFQSYGNIQLPLRITATKGDIKIKLIIKRWKL